MKIDPIFAESVCQRLGEYLPEEISGRAEFEDAVIAELEGLIPLSDPAVCEKRKQGLKLGCAAEDLRERFLLMPSGEEILCGARFKNLDPNFPFVDIAFGGAVSPGKFLELEEILRHEFRAIQPKGFKFKGPPGLSIGLDEWSHSVLGPIEAAPVKEVPQIQFQFTAQLDWFSKYQAEYRERLTEKPELKGFVRIADDGEFKEAAEAKALMIVQDAEGFAGVIAGISSPFYGLPALYMVESYLSKRWVGQGLAPFMHAKFLAELSSRFKFVWGTIYEKNSSSLRTAQRMGRNVVETEYFYPFR